MACKLLVIGICLLGIVLCDDGSICNTPECKALSKRLQSYMNLSVDPCEDFYEYACGGFEANSPLDQSMFSFRQNEITLEIDQALRAKSEAESDSKVVKFLTQFYHQCNLNDTRGLQPLKDAINELHEVKGNWTQVYAKLVGSFGVQPFLKLSLVGNQFKVNVAQISPAAGVITPSVLTEANNQAILQAYRKYIYDVAILLGSEHSQETNETVERIIQLETQLAHIHQKNQYNIIFYLSLSQLENTINETNWLELLNEIKAYSLATRSNFTQDDIVEIVNPHYIKEALEFLNQANQMDVKIFFTWIMLQQYGPLTTDEFRAIEAEFRRAVGDDRPNVSRQRCLDFSTDKFQHAVERLYADRFFHGSVQNQSSRMIAELRQSFETILGQTSWLDNVTEAKAVEKLEAITAYVGVPQWIYNSTELDRLYNRIFTKIKLEPNKVLESVFNLQRVEIGQVFDGHGSTAPIKSTIWDEYIPPLTVNAEYIPSLNDIVIPAGIIGTPFFDHSRPYVLNYGQLGAVIGHELTHGFDNNGRQFDKNGKFNDWWSKQTEKEFNVRAQCFIEQYGSIYDPWAKIQVNGKKTLGENIADNGGLKEAFKAFLNHQKRDGHAAQVLPELKLTAEQLFFLGFANNFCDSYTPDLIRQLIELDVHSPSRYRVLVPLSNSVDFAKAFNCPANAKMNPKHRCVVW